MKEYGTNIVIILLSSKSHIIFHWLRDLELKSRKHIRNFCLFSDMRTTTQSKLCIIRFQRIFCFMNVADIIDSKSLLTKKSAWNIMTLIELFILSKMKKMISILMTIYKRSRYTDNTIKSVLKNKKNPIEFIFLLDNPWNEWLKKIDEFREKRNPNDWVFKFYRQTWEGKINWLRNHAPHFAENDVVLIINDDIELSKNFDEVIEKNTKDNVFNPYFLLPQYEETQFKENNIAWHCFAMRKSDLKKVLPIDPRIKLRFWDDWIFHRAKEEWLKIEWSDLCICFHYCSKTLENPELIEEVNKQISEDIKNRRIILKEHNRKDRRFNL